MPSISIIILNWNGYEDTSELLESLFSLTYPNYKIVVVDNNSDNDEAGRLDSFYGDKISIIRCNENLGFTGGNNVGIKYCLEKNADYILLLNNDTTVDRYFLEILLNKFEAVEKTGIVAPRILYYDEPEKIWSDGGYISRLRGSGFAYSDKLESEVDNADKTVGFVSGCCMLVKKQVFETIGLFDENFFLYIEDTDLCFRTVKSGYKIFVTPRSKIFHKVNNSTKICYSTLPLYYATRNRLYFAKKNFSKAYYFTFSYLLLAMIIKSIIWLLAGRCNRIKSVHRAFKDFLFDIMGKTNQQEFL